MSEETNTDQDAADQKADGGADNAADQKADGGADNAADQKAADQKADGGVYRPDGLPDHFMGKTNEETIDHMKKALDGFRKDQAKKNIPEKADGYSITVPDELKEKIAAVPEDDPIAPRFKDIAHKHGLSNDTFNDLYLELSQAVHELNESGEGANANPDGLDFEYESLGGEEKAKPVVDGVMAWAEARKAAGDFDESDLKEVSVMASYSQGLNLLKKWRISTGEKPIPSDFKGSNETGLSEGDLNEMMRDPRYWKTKDPEFIAKVTAGFENLYAGKETA